MSRNRAPLIVGFLLVLAFFAIRRVVLHADQLEPAVITPQMDARVAVSSDINSRLIRLLHERDYADRSGRPKLIALTFDDGPYPIFTPLLLVRLQQLRVPATFFYIGRDAEEWPELAERTARDGDEICDHTYSHPDLDRETDAQVRNEILRGRDTLWGFVHDPGIREFVRPPHGRYTVATVRVAQSLGYKFILWTDDSGDWRTLTPQEIEGHLLAHATAPEIVLLHSGKLATIEALPEVVARFEAAGYRFVTVGELLARVPADDINHPAKHGV